MTELKYGQKVKITKGFYSGLPGKIVDFSPEFRGSTVYLSKRYGIKLNKIKTVKFFTDRDFEIKD